MITTLPIKRILLAEWLVDFRKGHLGLLGECRRNGLEPWSGDCVVFISRCRTRIKLLVADETGLWLGYKQFSKGTIATQLAFFADPQIKILSRSDLAMLLDGNKYTVTKRKAHWAPRNLD